MFIKCWAKAPAVMKNVEIRQNWPSLSDPSTSDICTLFEVDLNQPCLEIFSNKPVTFLSLCWKHLPELFTLTRCQSMARTSAKQ